MLTDSNYAEVLASGTHLVFFTAPWCAICRSLYPSVVDITEKAQVSLVKANVEDCPELAQLLEVRTLPTFVLYRDGKVAGGLVGAQPRARLERLLEP